MKFLHALLILFTLFASVFLQAQPLDECKLTRSLDMAIIEEPEDKVFKGDEIQIDHLPRTVYWCDGEYVQKGLDAISYFLRDRSETGSTQPVKPLLLDVIHEILEDLEYKGTIMIVSGYRTVQTQERLRKSGLYAASRISTHTAALAMDFYIPAYMRLGRKADCDNCRQKLYQTALKVLEKHRVGGLGAYCGPSIHVDVRRGIPRRKGDKRSIVRRWGLQMTILDGSRDPKTHEYLMGVPMGCMSQ